MTSTRPAVDESLRDAYLRRLGFGTPPPATVETLHAVHRAQVERVPYESVWVWLGERRTIEPLDSVRYLVSGRGGYCYHQNGALATLLGWLGFRVHWHAGGVQGHPDAKPNVDGNHLALTVSGLPSDDNPGGEWFMDVGLGDGLIEPVPLRTGTYTQGPHTYGLRPSEIAPGGWRLDADESMSLHGMDFTPGEATAADLVAEHERLQSAPDSSFVRTLVAFRRDVGGVDFLRGRVLKRLDTTGETTRELTSAPEWHTCLADVFGLPLSDVDTERKTLLWNRVTAAHEKWLAGSRQ
ncbi:arylamine N-acetyltransferase family protein [Actinophytocola algeriensis]|uniref:Arylamine N-acetyltransferase n=1 Tax=Actinophytocola algeriensis TaxID=1768010 RepID=A0A7W7QDX9_9PSEU|nr:arylamine N-acetyltransferase [Actinophytocola algeriensis]MBB4911856.1 arylamine N-acetyltransferase [Actinophytocola algeriensis]MBE1477652.1 arylamine N-acetyltransferase [Actinophytocola algeriensis]